MKYTILIIVAAISLMACGNKSSDNSSLGEATEVPKGQSSVTDDLSAKNILHIAIGSKDHSTLVAGVQATGLEDVLSNAGPLTVFAPTNAAFDALPPGTLDDLLKPENKATLSRIIKFHAAPGKYTLEMLKDNLSLYQASGHYVKIKNDGTNVSIEGANIIGSVPASNGIIHVIDKVILPPQ